MASQPATAHGEEKSYAPPPAAYGYYAAPPEGCAPAAPPEGSLVSYVEEFNRILKKMTCAIVICYPTDATIDRMKKRIFLAMNLDPSLAIDAVGPYLFKYQDGIYAGDADFFIENDYDAELKQSVNADEADLTAHIIPWVKSAWAESGIDQQEAFTEMVQTLLDVYLEYLAIRMASAGQ